MSKKIVISDEDRKVIMIVTISLMIIVLYVLADIDIRFGVPFSFITGVSLFILGIWERKNTKKGKIFKIVMTYAEQLIGAFFIIGGLILLYMIL